jgi:hypothetical protein
MQPIQCSWKTVMFVAATAIAQAHAHAQTLIARTAATEMTRGLAAPGNVGLWLRNLTDSQVVCSVSWANPNGLLGGSRQLTLPAGGTRLVSTGLLATSKETFNCWPDPQVAAQRQRESSERQAAQIAAQQAQLSNQRAAAAVPIPSARAIPQEGQDSAQQYRQQFEAERLRNNALVAQQQADFQRQQQLDLERRRQSERLEKDRRAQAQIGAAQALVGVLNNMGARADQRQREQAEFDRIESEKLAALTSPQGHRASGLQPVVPRPQDSAAWTESPEYRMVKRYVQNSVLDEILSYRRHSVFGPDVPRFELKTSHRADTGALYESTMTCSSLAGSGLLVCSSVSTVGGSILGSSTDVLAFGGLVRVMTVTRGQSNEETGRMTLEAITKLVAPVEDGSLEIDYVMTQKSSAGAPTQHPIDIFCTRTGADAPTAPSQYAPADVYWCRNKNPRPFGIDAIYYRLKNGVFVAKSAFDQPTEKLAVTFTTAN